MDAVRELKRISDKVAQAKIDAANAKGQMELLLQDIKSVTGAQTIEEAEEIAAKWEQELAAYPSMIESRINDLKNEYNL